MVLCEALGSKHRALDSESATYYLWDNLLNFTVSQSSHLYNGRNNSTSLIGLLWELNTIIQRSPFRSVLHIVTSQKYYLLLKKSLQHIYKGCIITLFLQMSKLRPTEIEVSIKNIKRVNGIVELWTQVCEVLNSAPIPSAPSSLVGELGRQLLRWDHELTNELIGQHDLGTPI